MRKTSLTSQSSPNVVSLSANVASTSTPIARITTPRGAVYRLHNSNLVRGAVVNGTYVILQLKDNAGNEISGASRVLVGTRGPADEYPKFHRALPYSIWAGISTVNQRNEDYKATMISQSDLNTGAGIEVPEGSQLLLYLESDQVVDWTKSFFGLDVEELN